MSHEEFNALFARNLKRYMEENDMTQADLAKRLGVGTTSVYNWINGIKTPRMDKVDAMCRIFGCSREDLIADKKKDDYYYLNDETRQIAQEAFERPDLRSLFHVARDIPPEILKAHIELMISLKKRENGEDC